MNNLRLIRKQREATWDQVTSNLLGDDKVLQIRLRQTVSQNPSKDLPYHNNQHMFAVALRAVEIWRYQSEKYLTSELQDLFIAASLHDYGHSGGKLSDSENIAIASKKVRDVVRDLPEKRIESIVELVQVTQYPFTKEPSTIEQKCIRDADLLTHLEPDYDTFLLGLATELSVPPISKEDNLAWFKEQTFYTARGQLLAGSIIKGS